MTRITHSATIPDTRAPSWHERAACKGRGDEMFPDSDAAAIEHAKTICRPCPVSTECLLDALRTGDNQHGIRGSLKPEERRALAKEPDPPAALMRERAQRPQSLTEAFTRRAKRTRDGHVVWYGVQKLKFQNTTYTALQAAFIIGHGRTPEGPVRRTCGTECFRWDHLTDTVIRDENAECGTPGGYARHRRHKETPCASCRKANTAADPRSPQHAMAEVSA